MIKNVIKKILIENILTTTFHFSPRNLLKHYHIIHIILEDIFWIIEIHYQLIKYTKLSARIKIRNKYDKQFSTKAIEVIDTKLT